MAIRILVIEDDEEDYLIIRALLMEIPYQKYELEWVRDRDSFRIAAGTRKHDVYLLDYHLGTHNGLEILKNLRSRGCQTPVLLLTGVGDRELDLDAMRAGAADYLTKDEISAALLERSIRYAIERKNSELKLYALNRTLKVLSDCNAALTRVKDESLLHEEVCRIIVGYNRYTAACVGVVEHRGSRQLRTVARAGCADGSPCASGVALPMNINGEFLGSLNICLETESHFDKEEIKLLISLADNLASGIKTIRAVARQRRLESQLRHAQKLEAIGTLAGGIAHDFNNILSIISGCAELARLEAPTEEQQHLRLAQILNAANRAKELVQQILAFSRQSERGKQPFYISTLLKEAVKLLSPSFPKNIDIQLNIRVDQGSDVILADPTQINQVIMNLCTNASYAMREEGGVLRMGLSMVQLGPEREKKELNIRSGSYLKLTISDTGQGIPEEVIDRIFEPYFTTKPFGEGTGLGLSVVHGIVTNHGGSISVCSTPGKGTTFNVFFPVHERLGEIEPESLSLMSSDSRLTLFTED